MDSGFVCKLMFGVGVSPTSTLSEYCLLSVPFCHTPFIYWSHVCPVVWRGMARVQSLQKSVCMQLSLGKKRPLALPIPCYSWVKSEHSSGNDKQRVSNHRNRLRSYCTHTVHPRQTVSSLFIVSKSLLVVEEALPFCAGDALISSKHLRFVYWRTCVKRQNI